MDANTKSDGTKIGHNLGWIEATIVDLKHGNKAVIVTLREKGVVGGVIAREIATRHMAEQLRIFAATLDKMVMAAAREEPVAEAWPASPV